MVQGEVWIVDMQPGNVDVQSRNVDMQSGGLGLKPGCREKSEHTKFQTVFIKFLKWGHQAYWVFMQLCIEWGWG